MDEEAKIVKRSGGWFVTGESWSGPWASELAAEFARQGSYEMAHSAHRVAPAPTATTAGQREE